MWQAKGRLPQEYTLPALQYLANLKIDHDGIQAASRPAQHGAAVAKHLPKCIVPNRLILEPDSGCDVVNSGDRMQIALDLDQYGTMDTFRWVWALLLSVFSAAVVWQCMNYGGRRRPGSCLPPSSRAAVRHPFLLPGLVCWLPPSLRGAHGGCCAALT